MSVKKKAGKSKGELPETSYVFYGLIVLLFYPPFFRGLFFSQELLLTHMFTALLFMVGMYFEPENRSIEVFGSLMDYGALGLLAIYILAGFMSVLPEEAYKEILKLINYLLVFYFVGYFARSINRIDRIFQAFYFSGFGIALIGVAAAAGIVNIEYSLRDNRIASLIQYPNTLAAYLIGILVIGLYLSIKPKNIYLRTGYKVMNFVVFLAFLGTQSRGGLLLLPVSFVLLFLGPLGRFRRAMLWEMVVPVAVALLVYSKSISNIAGNTTGVKSLWVILGILVVIIWGMLEDRIKNLSLVTKIRGRYIAAGLVVIVIMVAGIGIAGRAGKISPAFKRFSNISFQEQNVVERGIFYKDAMKAIEEHPVLGIGGGGWSAVYRQYRTYAYISKAVHNNYLQTMVEAGISGLTAYLAIWTAFLFVIIRNIRSSKQEQERTVNWVVLTAAVTIALHSAIDWNLMFGSISILLWSMFGLARGLENIAGTRYTPFGFVLQTGRRPVKITLVALLGVFIVASGVLFTGTVYGGQGIMEYNSGQLALAEANLDRAVKYDPLNGNYKRALAEIWISKAAATGDKGMLQTALNFAKGSIQLDYFDPDKHVTKARVHLKLGQAEEGVNEYEIALKLDPTNQIRYNDLADVYLRAGKYYAYLDKKDEARKYFNLVCAVPGMIQQEIKKIPFSDKMPWVKQNYNLSVTMDIEKYVQEAQTNLAKL